LKLTGRSIIGFSFGEYQGDPANAFNPTTGEDLQPAFYSASLEEVDMAANLAAQSFETYSRLPGATRARFLRQIANNIEGLGEALTVRATQETGLPEARIKMETARTCFQLRLFADLAAEGSWVDARIDRSDPERRPVPRPDIRSMLRPLGPVVVFCASNFPLAFSVAGGDTASALAAGCPVVVKAHHSHPGTAELVGMATRDAVRSCELPEGVFSLLFGPGQTVGVALVKHPSIKAGGFTGSRAGGRSLMELSASRPEPMPFYAEMSSINPVFILPGALNGDPTSLAEGLYASVTLGAGQFCTNPGLVVLNDNNESKVFSDKLAGLMSNSLPFTMLNPGISSAYRREVDGRAGKAGITTVVNQSAEAGKCQSGAVLFETDAQSFLADFDLGSEIFGPSTLLVKHSTREQLLQIARSMEGQLTATVHGTEEDLVKHSDLLAILESKVGRIVFNGFPTGVEVCHSMVHGGPFPATSDGRSTSVGTRSIFRFTRAVCYQNFPEASLPDELRDSNPCGIRRIVDGRLSE
jgi:NADP-dependent aldehyde dehydrogenase